MIEMGDVSQFRQETRYAPLEGRVKETETPRSLMWPLPFGSLGDFQDESGSVFYPFCDLIDSDTEKMHDLCRGAQDLH